MTNQKGEKERKKERKKERNVEEVLRMRMMYPS